MNVFLFLSGHSTFSWSSLWPVVLLLALAAIIPVVLSLCHLKSLSVLVIQIVVGIILASIPYTRDLFLAKETIDGTLHTTEMLAALPEGLYMIGLALLLFLSGLEVDFSVLRIQKKGNHQTLHAFGMSWLLFAMVVLCSFGAAMLFRQYFTNHWWGVALMTAIFFTTFAPLVIPAVHEKNLQNTTIGKILCTYSTIAEFMSICLLSVIMVARGIVEDRAPWLLTIVIGILLFVYIIQRFVPGKVFTKAMGGFVHLSVRLIILVLLVLVIITDLSGAEFILGAFLAGAVFKAANLSHHTMEKMETIGYGIFIPMFYILVGFKVGISMPIQEFIRPQNLLLIGLLILALILVKIPFLLLAKWYKLSTVLPTMLMATCTIIVAITAEHFGFFENTFVNALIVASAFTCLIPPLFFANQNSYGASRSQYDAFIITPHDLEEDRVSESIMHNEG